MRSSINTGLSRFNGVTALVCFGSLLASAQNAQTCVDTTVPVEVISGLVYMPGGIDHSRPLQVILDTGASFPVLAPELADSLVSKPDHATEAAGLGSGKNETLELVGGATLRWGGIGSTLSLSDQTVALTPIQYIAEQDGHSTDAILGSSLFKAYRVKVDYARKRVSFLCAAQASVKAQSEGAVSLPIDVQSGIPLVHAKVRGEDGKDVDSVFMIDSGLTAPLILSRKFLTIHPGMITDRHLVPAATVSAVGGAISTNRGRLERLSLGPFDFSGIIATIPTESKGVLANPAIAGMIGTGLLERFTEVWDYASGRLLLKPNKTFSDPFLTDCSGLHLKSPPPNYRDAIVDVVLPGSPAEKAGIVVGDEILAMNGRRDMKIWQLYGGLKHPGSVILPIKTPQSQTKDCKLLLRNPMETIKPSPSVK